jgi:hypothetical protein
MRNSLNALLVGLIVIVAASFLVPRVREDGRDDDEEAHQ